MDPVEIIKQVRSGVVRISLEHKGKVIGSGSGFLVKYGLVTNSHVIRKSSFDTLILGFAEDSKDNVNIQIRLLKDNVYNSITAESPEEENDFIYIKLQEPEFKGRHIFEFSDFSNLSVGEQVLFMGYPFGMNQLTSHLGYVSSKHSRNNIEIIQIDGSVNGGNSGGPLIDLKNEKVAGIITRAVTGIVEQQAQQLLEALKNNQEVLKRSSGMMQLSGIDPIQAIGASQLAMEKIARDLYRTANVGIGYAYSANYVRDTIK